MDGAWDEARLSSEEDGGGSGAVVGEVDALGCGGKFVEGFVGGAVGEPAEVAELEGNLLLGVGEDPRTLGR